MTKTNDKKASSEVSSEGGPSRFDVLNTAALIYGERSFDNYVQIRSLASQIRAGFCDFLGHKEQCVYLVPPQGAFQSSDYGSAAYSVSGKGVLPLEPIAFGLAVRVTEDADFMRLVLHCSKAGDRIFVQVEGSQQYDFSLPLSETELNACFEGLYKHVVEWFQGRVDQYDNGNYGSNDIGFDIQRVTGE